MKMIVTIAAGLAAGIFVGVALDLQLSSTISFYITMALLAATDSLFGAGRSYLEGRYNHIIFITGFVGNSILAGLLAFLGDKLGVPLYYATILVFGGRLFNNLAAIRRILVEQYIRRRKTKRIEGR